MPVFIIILFDDSNYLDINLFSLTIVRVIRWWLLGLENSQQITVISSESIINPDCRIKKEIRSSYRAIKWG